ncbi:hypothetical protein GF385_04345, partial [Candidatus Dependentiae bacterium]|nr:hypothetical protein [Candidatus Dependentiae bacterium]
MFNKLRIKLLFFLCLVFGFVHKTYAGYDKNCANSIFKNIMIFIDNSEKDGVGCISKDFGDCLVSAANNNFSIIVSDLVLRNIVYYIDNNFKYFEAAKEIREVYLKFFNEVGLKKDSSDKKLSSDKCIKQLKNRKDLNGELLLGGMIFSFASELFNLNIWEIYALKGYENSDFYLIVPNVELTEYDKSILKKYFIKIPTKIFKEKRYKKEENNITDIKNLTSILERIPTEIVFCVGHGVYKRQVAGLGISIFKKLLEFLHNKKFEDELISVPIRIKLLIINSCFAGGRNSKIITDYMKTIKSKGSIFDILFLSMLNDTSIFALNCFLPDFSKKDIWYLKKREKCYLKDKFFPFVNLRNYANFFQFMNDFLKDKSDLSYLNKAINFLCLLSLEDEKSYSDLRKKFLDLKFFICVDKNKFLKKVFSGILVNIKNYPIYFDSFSEEFKFLNLTDSVFVLPSDISKKKNIKIKKNKDWVIVRCNNIKTSIELDVCSNTVFVFPSVFKYKYFFIKEIKLTSSVKGAKSHYSINNLEKLFYREDKSKKSIRVNNFIDSEGKNYIVIVDQRFEKIFYKEKDSGYWFEKNFFNESDSKLIIDKDLIIALEKKNFNFKKYKEKKLENLSGHIDSLIEFLFNKSFTLSKEVDKLLLSFIKDGDFSFIEKLFEKSEEEKDKFLLIIGLLDYIFSKISCKDQDDLIFKMICYF